MIHQEVRRESIPAYDHEDTGYRVTCSCGRQVVSVFPWLIEKWLSDHDFARVNEPDVADDEWPGDGREPCGCNGTPHWLTDACPLQTRPVYRFGDDDV